MDEQMKKDFEDKEKSAKKFERRLNRILIKLMLIVLLIVFVLGGGYILFQKFSLMKIERKGALVATQLEKCQELVTVKNHYSDIVTIKKTRIAGLAKSFSIVRFYGVVRVGISDLSKAEYKISENGKKISIKLPSCEILGNDISGIEVFDESRSIFVAVSLKEVVDEISSNKELTEAELIDDGIIDEANIQVRQIVLNTMLALGFSDVEIE